jgi:hypothetical protein
MTGKNWNSKKGSYSNIVGNETLKKSKRALELYNNGKKVSEIAQELGLSKSRIYEYLKEQ